MLATTLITLQMVFVTPVVLYVPALVFNEVTGINFYAVTIATCLICIFYTCVGGFTAVIYTDMIQTIVMILALLITNIKGTDVAGGLQSVWRENYNSGRMDFVKTDIDVTLRYTIWAIFIGYSPNMMAYGCLNQGTMQRYRSVSSLNSARKLLVVYIVFGASLFAIIAYSGLMLYANYHDCDPLTTQVVKKKDQILTFFVRSTLADVTGLTGLFLAGVFSAGLSTISTTLNSLSGVLLQDFYISLTKKQISEDEGSRIMKIFVIILGIIVTGMTLVVDKMGTIYQISASLSGLINGPIVGIFTIGIFLPTIRGKAVLIGTTLSFLFTMWMYIGSLIYPSNKLSESKSFSVDGCTYNFTLASLPTSSVKNENVFLLYKVSFFWYAFIGFSLTIIISVFMSIFMERNDTSSMDPKLFSHLFRRSSSRNKKESGTPAVEMKLLK